MNQQIVACDAAKGKAGVMRQPLRGVSRQAAVGGECGQNAGNQRIPQPQAMNHIRSPLAHCQFKRRRGSHGKRHIHRACPPPSFLPAARQGWLQRNALTHI